MASNSIMCHGIFLLRFPSVSLVGERMFFLLLLFRLPRTLHILIYINASFFFNLRGNISAACYMHYEDRDREQKSGNSTEQKWKQKKTGCSPSTEAKNFSFTMFEKIHCSQEVVFWYEYYDYTLLEYLISCLVGIPDACKLKNSIIHTQITNWLIAFHYGQIFDVAHEKKRTELSLLFQSVRCILGTMFFFSVFLALFFLFGSCNHPWWNTTICRFSAKSRKLFFHSCLHSNGKVSIIPIKCFELLSIGAKQENDTNKKKEYTAATLVSVHELKSWKSFLPIQQNVDGKWRQILHSNRFELIW